VLANRVVALVHAFMTWCEVQGIRPRGSNPAIDVKPFKETSRERFLTSEELGRLIKAIDEEAVSGNPHTIGALRFLTLTGWRRQEVFSLQWDAVDLERGIATLMRTKTGKSQRIPSKAAVKVLKSLPRTVGHPYAFESPAHKPNPKWPKGSVIAGGRKSRSKSNKPPTRREPGLHPIASVDYLWYRVRAKAELKAFRLHDLRHSAASSISEAGASLTEIGAVLGHRNTSTTTPSGTPSGPTPRPRAVWTPAPSHAALHAPHEWQIGALDPDGTPRMSLRQTLPLLTAAR
jgi:integrase